MEDILYAALNVDSEIVHPRRLDIVKTRNSTPTKWKWKAVLWEKHSVEPAMLRVPIVILVLITLWGFNVLIMERIRLQYHSALSVKSISLSFIFTTAIAFAIIFATTITLVSTVFGFSVEFGMLIYYSLILIFSYTSGIPGQDSRAAFLRLTKLVFFPASSVAFPEVLLADALTSLSKIFKDIGLTIVSMAAVFSQSDIISMHENGMILIALLASWPFWIRIRQCWVQFEGTNDILVKIPVLLNIGKYLTGFPPIWLVASASLGYHHPQLPALTASMAALNSIYSYGWDIIMDWGFLSFTRTGQVHMRKRCLYHWTFYVVAVVINLVLRFSWAANRVPYFSHMHSSHLVLIVELGEVVRRFVWFFLRIEWEILVQDEKRELMDEDKNEADKKLLAKINKPDHLTSIPEEEATSTQEHL